MILRNFAKTIAAILGLLVSIGLPDSASAQDRIAPPPIQVVQMAPPSPPREVNLYRTARIEFEPDQCALAAIGDLPVRRGQDVDLFVDGESKLLRCERVSKLITQAQGEAMCAALMESANIALPFWFDLAGWEGRLGVRFSSRPAPTHEPVIPVAFGSGATLATFRVRMADLDAEDQDQCSAWLTAGQDLRFSAQSRAAVCDAVLANRSVLQESCTPDPINPKTSPAFLCPVAIRPIPDPIRHVYSVAATDDELRRPLLYPAPLMSEVPRFGPDEITIRPASAARIQYPSRALRSEMEGVTLLQLGIGANGRVATCRPIQTSGHLILDTASCRQIVRYGRFTFAEGADEYEGLKYLRVPLNWTIPE